jgi:hypothetical protein
MSTLMRPAHIALTLGKPFLVERDGPVETLCGFEVETSPLHQQPGCECKRLVTSTYR